MTPGEIDKLYVGLDTKLRKFKQEFASEFVQRVEERTPVDTGKLKAGWVTKQTQTGFEISNTQPYAGYVENGTDKMAPRLMIATTLVEKDQITEIAKERAGLK